MSKIHWAEYDEVMRASDVPGALAKLHDTPCTQEEALKILAWCESVQQRRADTITHVSGTTHQEFLPLRVFFMGHRGRASVRRRREGFVQLISLPVGGKRLRVGIVLHEYAHHVAPAGCMHSQPFVNVLDRLVQRFNSAVLPQAVPVAAGMHRSYVKRSKCFRCGVGTTRKHSRTGIASCGRCEASWP